MTLILLFTDLSLREQIKHQISYDDHDASCDDVYDAFCDDDELLHQSLKSNREYDSLSSTAGIHSINANDAIP